MTLASTRSKASRAAMAPIAFALLLSAATVTAHAHQVWIERSAPSGPAQIHYGDVDGERPRGEALRKLQATTRVFGTDPQETFQVELKQDQVEARVDGPGDVRMINDGIWKPFKNKEGLMHAVIFNSRAGRAETTAALDLELVPVQAHGNTVALRFKGKPVAGSSITVINPALWRKTFLTDEQGRITIPDVGKGRYVLLGSYEFEGEAQVGPEKVQSVKYVTSLTFIAD
ncbi:MAG: nickel uptake transporter family protein [Burkholderiaceae bacterium]